MNLGKKTARNECPHAGPKLSGSAEMGEEEFGGGLAGGGGGGAEVAVDQAGAVAGVEETAFRGLGAHAHDGDGAGGAGQEIQAHLHVLL